MGTGKLQTGGLRAPEQPPLHPDSRCAEPGPARNRGCLPDPASTSSSSTIPSSDIWVVRASLLWTLPGQRSRDEPLRNVTSRSGQIRGSSGTTLALTRRRRFPSHALRTSGTVRSIKESIGRPISPFHSAWLRCRPAPAHRRLPWDWGLRPTGAHPCMSSGGPFPEAPRVFLALAGH